MNQQTYFCSFWMIFGKVMFKMAEKAIGLRYVWNFFIPFYVNLLKTAKTAISPSLYPSFVLKFR